MTRELGIIADLQCAEVAMSTKYITLGFDATTQEGDYVNSIHLTTKTGCQVVAVDQLAGGGQLMTIRTTYVNRWIIWPESMQTYKRSD